MRKLYNKCHLVHCDVRKSITVSVDQCDPSGAQSEKSLDISLTDDGDLYFLYKAKIFSLDYQRLKEQQGLLVEYNAFSQMLMDLLAKCLAEENSSSPRYILQFSESSSPPVLRVVETTDFRHLTHLAIELTAASDDSLKAYLVQYIKKTKNDMHEVISNLEKSKSRLSVNLSDSEKNIQILAKRIEDITISKDLDVLNLKNKYEEEIKDLKSTHESVLSSFRSKFTLETKAAEESHAAVILSMQTNADLLASELKTIRDHESSFLEQILSLKTSLSQKEVSLCKLQDYNEDLKINLTEKAKKSDDLERQCGQLAEKVSALEIELDGSLKKVDCLQLELTDERSKLAVSLEEVRKKTKHLEKVEKLLKQQTAEVNKANTVIKQMQKDLKNSQAKAKLRGQVATEQEKILTSRDSELEDAQQKIEQLKSQLTDEISLREQCETKAKRIESDLQEAHKTIKANENIINWLNRQISESYSSSLQQRLKSSGVPLPGNSSNGGAGNVDIPILGKNSLDVDRDTVSGLGVVLSPFMTSTPPVTLTHANPTVNTPRYSSANEVSLTAKTNLHGLRFPSVTTSASQNSAPDGGNFVLLASGESALSRPPVRLSSGSVKDPMRKPEVPASKFIIPGDLDKNPTLNYQQKRPINQDGSGTKRDHHVSISSLEGRGSKAGDDGSIFLNDRQQQQQSLTSSYFPQAGSAR